MMPQQLNTNTYCNNAHTEPLISYCVCSLAAMHCKMYHVNYYEAPINYLQVCFLPLCTCASDSCPKVSAPKPPKWASPRRFAE
jgi:hypothetical protein